MAPPGHRRPRARRAGMLRVAWFTVGLAGSLPGAATALPVIDDNTAASDEAVVARLLPFQAPAEPNSDPPPPVRADPVAAPEAQRVFEPPAGRTPTRAPAPRPAVSPGPRDGVVAEPALTGALEAPVDDMARGHGGPQRHALALGDILPLDAAEEAEMRRAVRSFAESTSEAMAWLQPAVDTLRGSLLRGDTSELLEGLSERTGWPAGGTVTGLAVPPGTGPVASMEPGQRADLVLVASAHRTSELERNIVRELISKIRRLLDQPLLWFVVFLVIVGWSAVSAAKRWLR